MRKMVKVMDSFRSVVDYRDRNKETVLSSWTRYSDLHYTAVINVLAIEMNAMFELLNRKRDEAMEIAKKQSQRDQIAALKNVAVFQDKYFMLYSEAVADSYGLKIIWANNYAKYINFMLSFGSAAHGMIFDICRYNWVTCSDYMHELTENDVVAKTTAEEWFRLIGDMKIVFHKYKK